MSIQTLSIHTLAKNPETFQDQKVRVNGWIKQIRGQKRFSFIKITDGSFFTPIQIVAEREKLENFPEVSSLGTGAAIIVEGTFLLTPDARQPYEINAERIEIEGACPPDYPLQPKTHTPEYLRSIAHLRPRTNLFSAVFKIRSEASFAIHKFFHDRNFVYVHTPIITASDAEGAGEMFRVTTLDQENLPLTEDGKVDYSKDFFGKSTFLSVSGQLNGESFAQALGKIYTFGPTFRAEHSNTPRHAAEFWMIEPEIAFADLDDVMDLAEDMLRYVIHYVLENCAEEMEFCNKQNDPDLIERLKLVADTDFKRISYTEAIEILEKSGKKFQFPVSWGVELQTEHERYLTEEVFKGPVFVTDYPKDVKAFYMRLNDDGKTVAAVDCLVPLIGEIIGGSQREERLDYLLKMMEEKGVGGPAYDWYVELRKYGTTHHGGYGLGFERLIMYLTGVSNIRDVLPFPRTTGQANF
jgi:asparaginyl-tRNA synthetase